MLKEIFIFSFFCICWVASEEYSSSSPLILTPYLEKGDVNTARELSKVTPDFGNVVSYSGYFSVKKKKSCENNLFFWLFPAVTDWENAPVILWLQGGLGTSSMYGLFEQIGPFNSLPEGLKPRKTSWTNFANVIFIDNPVRTGFSFSTNNCYPQSISAVAEELYSGLEQFFQLFPELNKNNLFLAGEGFAGHYIPALGTLIDKKHSKRGVIMNLKGIVMGNPNVKLDCHDYGSYLYQVGLADETLRDELYKSQRSLKNHIKKKEYSDAFSDWEHILKGQIMRETGVQSLYTIITEPPHESTYITYLNTSEIKKQLHVGSQAFIDYNEDVFQSLVNTIAQPSSHDVEKLLRTKKYIVAIYSGNLDIICLHTSAKCVMRNLNWHGQQDYLKAARNIWYHNDEVVGSFKTADNLLLDILVKDAQHSAIYSRPEVTYSMMQSIVSAEPGQNPLWALQTARKMKDID